MSDGLNTKNLDQIIKALKGELPRARVGILGAKAARGEQKGPQVGKSLNASNLRPKKINFTNNAAIGALHEFGGKNVPARSFLRIPIADHLQSKMERAGAFEKNSVKQVVKEGSLMPWVKRIAVLAEAIVIEAFATKGFGRWPAWKNPNYKNAGNTILVDSGQLRDSITSDVR